jgi:hypothetical protein
MQICRVKLAQTTLELPFEARAISALGISVVADALDYAGAPIFALPVIGDIADGIVIALLYRLTGSKISTAINAIEFIPVIGDMVPTYTISTLMWILRESRKRKDGRLYLVPKERKEMVTRVHDRLGRSTIIDASGSDGLQTKIMRTYAIFRSRMR